MSGQWWLNGSRNNGAPMWQVHEKEAEQTGNCLEHGHNLTRAWSLSDESRQR
jgi:hypothetical protein